MILVAIDYDSTYTTDPQLWDIVIRILQTRMEVVCVTMRYESETILHPLPCMIYYTGRKAKLYWCRANQLKPDIWIDDDPSSIMKDLL